MTRPFHVLLCCVGASVLLPSAVTAQELTGCNTSTQLSYTFERVGEDHYRRIGAVEIECSEFKFYAEQMEFFTDASRLIASGNVVFTSAGHRIGADRVEFDTKTNTGVFYNAAGSATLGDQVDRSMFGSQEPDAYFYGETIEKLGPRKYRLSKGAFTTCVQPTPRWEIAATAVILNLDEYALLRNSVLRVKGVPLFYMPVFYYPMEEDDRATGFLIPAYGASTIKGQTISSAFFWAITRSQDATFFHDWFSKTGQGLGSEYRYVLGPGSEGSAGTYLLTERETLLADGRTQPGRRSYQIRGTATQLIGDHLRGRGKVDYFSDLTVQQLYQTNILEASRRQRSYGGNMTGVWGAYTLSGTFDRNEVFFGQASSTIVGTAPRVSFSRAERPIVGRAVYVSLGSDYATLLRRSRSGARESDTGLTRLHVDPRVRVPFTRWPFLTINSSVGWPNTFWSERLAADTGAQVEERLTRRFFDLQTEITGPVFVKIWDARPGSSYAERFKHVIEPSFTLQRVTAIDVFDRIVRLDSLDSIVGSATRFVYGLTNRIYAKRYEGDSAPVAREIVTIGLTQSYYTDARAAQFDRQYRTSFQGAPPSHLSPISLIARTAPTEQINATFRADYDTQFMAFRTLAADGVFAMGDWLQATGGWSQRRFIEGLKGFDDPRRLDHFLSGQTILRSHANVIGGIYTFNYDVLRRSFLQQRIVGYYNAQCCGVTVEFQTFDLSRLGSRAPVLQDRRFNIGFALAGIGTFSNFLGALGGTGR